MPSIFSLLRITLSFVGVHSIILGCSIYFFTTPFYQLFFSVEPDNFFFIKQSGLFLILAGLFYLVPVMDLAGYQLIIFLVIVSKIAAVIFLVRNAYLTPSPAMVYLAAVGDGVMAMALTSLLWLWRKYDKKNE